MSGDAGVSIGSLAQGYPCPKDGTPMEMVAPREEGLHLWVRRLPRGAEPEL